VIEQAIVGLVALGLAVWVLQPMAGRRRRAVPAADPRIGDLMEAKQSVYRSLIDLELDHELGKLDPEDYAWLRQEAKKEALDLIHQIEGQAQGSDDDTTLEEEIRAARARLRRE
jgi:hypothetical protein